MDYTNFSPETKEIVDVTQIFEERHAQKAFSRINTGLNDYLSPYSKEYASELCLGGYCWILLGEFPISGKLQQLVREKYKVSDDGEIKFARFETLKAQFPDVRYPKIKGTNPAFVGFPLPKEEL